MALPGGPAVLVVEDDDAIRATVHAVLAEEGYTVFDAPDGRPALTRLRESPDPSVVLLDLNMPGMDGVQVLQAVAAHETLATRHAYLLLSAYAQDLSTAVSTLLRQLHVPVVRKPFELDVLVDAVAAATARLASGE